MTGKRKATEADKQRVLEQLLLNYREAHAARDQLFKASETAHKSQVRFNAICARQEKLHAMLHEILQSLATDAPLPDCFDLVGSPALELCPSCNGSGCSDCNGSGCVKGQHATDEGTKE